MTTATGTAQRVRYEVRSPIQRIVSERFYVLDTTSNYTIARRLTETDANVIAFALNAVSDGYQLEAHKSVAEGLHVHSRYYDSPLGGTES